MRKGGVGGGRATRTLRAPVYKGLRDDKRPEDVVFEKPEPPPA